MQNLSRNKRWILNKFLSESDFDSEPHEFEILEKDSSDSAEGLTKGSKSLTNKPPGSMDPTKDSIDPPKDSMDPPKDSMDPPEEFMDTTKGSTDPPKDSVNQPKDSVDPPKDSVNPSKDSVDPSKDSVDPSKDSVDPSKDSVDPPKDSVDPPADSIKECGDLRGEKNFTVKTKRKKSIKRLKDLTKMKPRKLNHPISLKEHIKTHSCKNFECSQCDKKYFELKRLNEHIRNVHDPETRVECPFCRIKFNKHSMKPHIKLVHDPNRNALHSCPRCGAKFLSSFSLKSHLRVHKAMDDLKMQNSFNETVIVS